MTRYTHAQSRRIKTEQRNEQRKREDRDEKYIHADSIMREYEKAYAAYHGHDIQLKYYTGWVTRVGHDGTQAQMAKWGPVRLHDLPARTAELWSRVHAQEIENGSAT